MEQKKVRNIQRIIADQPVYAKTMSQVDLDWDVARIMLYDRGIDPDSSDYDGLLGALVIAIGAERRG